jgi:phage shock protein A
MIIGKIWRAFRAQMNKVANYFWTADPIAQLQYEYDRMVDQLKEGREGLEQYRALVERVTRQVDENRSAVTRLEAKVRTYLKGGDRESAARFALDLQKAKKDLQENEGQLRMYEEAYNNNLAKIKHASHKLGQLRDKIKKYDADLKLSRAEAELGKIAQNFNVDITTDFGQIEQVLQDEIDRNRARAKVSADLSSEGLEEVRREQAIEQTLAEQALREFEMEDSEGAGTPRLPAPKEDGPATSRTSTSTRK